MWRHSGSNVCRTSKWQIGAHYVSAPTITSNDRPGDCNRQSPSWDTCDRACNWPQCGCVLGKDGEMRPAPMASEDRFEEWWSAYWSPPQTVPVSVKAIARD